ncbi:RNA polymerase sigma-70 factor [Dyadobacter sp.]|uniref:RNA polymerase sigma-70 factor n=1 Tax=Dyadobacter sp. TaxID=1914288 RepID=UPI003F728CDD
MGGFTRPDHSEDQESSSFVAGNAAARAGNGGGLSDGEFFIRKTFETDVQKGCELLFQRYYKPMCSHAVRFVYSKDVAEDIVAEIFCNFWDNGTYQTVHSSFGAYLFASVRNRCFNYLQKEQNKTLSLDAIAENDPVHSILPEKIMQYEELYQQVNTLVTSLSPQCQKVFIMNRFEGKAGKEIAAELSLSTRTVEAHIAKALSILRNGLRHYWTEILLLAQSGLLMREFENILTSL